MAPKKKLTHQVTLELTAGNAPVVDLGKMLGQTGVNLVEIKKAYDAATAAQRGTSVRTGGGQAALRLQLHGAAAAGETRGGGGLQARRRQGEGVTPQP